MSAEDNKKDGGGWTKIPVKLRPPVVNEDHPVVKKILDFIEKEIEPIENETITHSKFNNYLGRLPEEELVIYGIYQGITSIPAIYKEDAKRPVNRTDKLSGDVLDVHNAPTDLQES